MQHKWHKEIKAWADGAEIQAKTSWSDGRETGWHSIGTPHWESDVEYRIKPQPKEPQYLYVYQEGSKIHLGLVGMAIEVKSKYLIPEFIGKIPLITENDNGYD